MPDQMPGDAAAAAQSLLRATRAFLRPVLAEARWSHLRAAFPDERAPARTVASRPLPVLRWLEGTGGHAAPESRQLCAALAQTAPHWHWGQTYTAADFGAAFLERYGWMELIGRRGLFVSEDLACGFLLLGPGIEYPRHRHEAEEVYIVLSGTAEWRKAAGSFVPRVPGTLIHHPPRCWHAMRTGEQALLTLYLWSGGDLTQKSEIGAPS